MKGYRLLPGALLCALMLAACATAPAMPTAAPTATPVPTALSSPTPAAEARQPGLVSPVGMDGVLVKGTAGQPWWNDTVFYEIFVRSFYDSNGDGIGDLCGLISKLDYLNDGRADTSADLGITGIWLMPIMASPSYHGYDVTDYFTVNPQYGTNSDFKRLIAEAHRRGIRVVIDLVLNHTSSQHPWFIEAQDPKSPRHDWYVWADQEPKQKGWYPGKNGGYYYGYFWEGMPDLNYKNPAVTAEMNRVVRFWLADMGADGFRLDAVKYLYEDGRQIEHLPATHEWLRAFRSFYLGINPQAFTVGEVWSDAETAAKYVVDELAAVFDFSLAETAIDSAVNGEVAQFMQAAQTTTRVFPAGRFATFLANHDQQRTRSRLLDDAQAKTVATLQLTFGGVPFIYYGEEIGMEGAKPDENIRRPMQWTPDGGFTSGAPWNDYFNDFRDRNVERQSADPDSILNHYRALIRLRNSHEALRIGEWWPVRSDSKAVYASLRSTEREQILVLINLGSKPVEAYHLSLESGLLRPGLQAVLLLGKAEQVNDPAIDSAGGFADYRPIEALPARSCYMVQFTK